MTIFKCKMCGGDLDLVAGATTCECAYCGTTQTVPAADDEKKANLFNRANRLRMAAEYDKAATVYASITAEFPEEAEAYWGLCLCKYGIEYVDDPATGRKLPTCHRTRPESILDDADFDQACENADGVARRLYREEAKEIDRIQRDILEIVAKEAPYDAFICYKETDADGNRTEDSVLAQEIYDALTARGLRVFFARVTLEDVLGRQYEPYIYAALHSARVMLAVGTDYEHFNAPWVKNEWSRFLDMMKGDRAKALIPCYKGIDAYDMPREFKNLQGQDMGKLGWLQDLTRGVMKLCGRDEHAGAARAQEVGQAAAPSGSTAESLLRRAFMFLEDQKWREADEYAEKALDIEPENGRAYLAKLLASMQVKTPEALGGLLPGRKLEANANYIKAARFGDEATKAMLEGALSRISACKRELEAERDAVAAQAGALWEKRRGEIDLLSAQMDTSAQEQRAKQLHDEMAQLTKRHASLGLFKGREKKEIETRIQGLKGELEGIEEKINATRIERDRRIDAIKAQFRKEDDQLRQRQEEINRKLGIRESTSTVLPNADKEYSAPKASVKSPMPGRILRVDAKVNSVVKKGDVLLILEAMFLQNEVCAPEDGVVYAVCVKAGANVNTGDVLVTYTPA